MSLSWLFALTISHKLPAGTGIVTWNWLSITQSKPWSNEKKTWQFVCSIDLSQTYFPMAICAKYFTQKLTEFLSMALFNSSWACCTLTPRRLVPSTFSNWSPGQTPPKKKGAYEQKTRDEQSMDSTGNSFSLNVIGSAMETETYRVQPCSHALEHLSRKFRHRVPLTPVPTLTPTV